MIFYKKFLKTSFIQDILAWIMACYLKFVYKTCTWTFEGEDYVLPYITNNRPFILAFWHNRLMMCPFARLRLTKPLSMLISGHSDGLLISKTVSHFNIQTIAGSKSKGGLSAMKNILSTLKSGQCIGITPDGPRGPRFIVSEGIINIARLSKCDIVLLCYSIRRRKVLNSWDRFIIPLPFSRGIIAWGKPVDITARPDNSTQHHATYLSNHMNQLADYVDDFCGHNAER